MIDCCICLTSHLANELYVCYDCNSKICENCIRSSDTIFCNFNNSVCNKHWNSHMVMYCSIKCAHNRLNTYSNLHDLFYEKGHSVYTSRKLQYYQKYQLKILTYWNRKREKYIYRVSNVLNGYLINDLTNIIMKMIFSSPYNKIIPYIRASHCFK